MLPAVHRYIQLQIFRSKDHGAKWGKADCSPYMTEQVVWCVPRFVPDPCEMCLRLFVGLEHLEFLLDRIRFARLICLQLFFGDICAQLRCQFMLTAGGG